MNHFIEPTEADQRTARAITQFECRRCMSRRMEAFRVELRAVSVSSTHITQERIIDARCADCGARPGMAQS